MENLVRFCFLQSVHYIKPIPSGEKNICCGEKVAQMPLFNLIFLRLGWPWVWGVRRFHSNIHTFSNPKEFGKSQNTLVRHKIRARVAQPLGPTREALTSIPRESEATSSRRTSFVCSAASPDRIPPCRPTQDEDEV